MLVKHESEKLPEVLWFQVFKYLSIREFVELRLISKTLNEYIGNYADIYESECVRIFTSNLNLFE